MKQLGEEKVSEWRLWFDKRLDEAIEAAEVEAQLEGGESKCRSVFIEASHNIIARIQECFVICDEFSNLFLSSHAVEQLSLLVHFNKFLEGKLNHKSFLDYRESNAAYSPLIIVVLQISKLIW